MSDLYSTGIRPIIDDYLLQKSKEVRDYKEYWSASQSGYCMRKVIFERLGVPPVTEDARKTRVFEAGHVFHAWAQNITKQAGISIAQELELLDEDLKIKGHFDDLVLLPSEFPVKEGGQPINDRLVLYDVKTAHSKWFEYKRTNAISHYHKMQLGTYMYMLRNWDVPVGDFNALETVNTSELTEARILHISKDDLRMAETILFWSPELEKEVYEYWSTLNGYWKNKKIPACTCANYEGGFLAKEKYNPYFYQGEPCSLAWYQQFKAEQSSKERTVV